MPQDSRLINQKLRELLTDRSILYGDPPEPLIADVERNKTDSSEEAARKTEQLEERKNELLKIFKGSIEMLRRQNRITEGDAVPDFIL